MEQEYNKDAWNVLSRHYLEWTKSISSEDTENVKKYHRWSLPVNSLLRSKDLPENVTPEDKKSIRPIIKTLDGLIKNCPPVPVEFTAYRAVSSEMTLEEARALVGKSITPDNGFMSTAVNKPLAVNDFLQKDESKILYEITVPRGEKGIWMPAVTNFKESVSREGEFLLPRESRFIVTGAEEQWFINRRSRNAEDVHAYGQERKSPPQFKEKRLVVKLTLENQKSEQVEPGSEINGADSWIKAINKIFEKNYGLSTPEEKLPRVVKAAPNESCAYVNWDLDRSLYNVIRVRFGKQILDGNAVGEEMGHFYRAQLKPSNISRIERLSAWLKGSSIVEDLIIDKKGDVKDKKEHITNEFFGFLGRRLLHKSYPKNKDGTSKIFPDGEPKIDSGDKKFAVGALKRIRKNLNSLKSLFMEGGVSLESLRNTAEPFIEARIDILHHRRGYEFASKVDLDKITNWNKLFSMPDKEVRKRFFTPNPDYSGL